MANCVLCGRWGGLFGMSLTDEGVCKPCVNTHFPIIDNHCRIILESARIIETSKKPETRLSRINVALQNLHALIPYSKKGIGTLNKPPEEVMETFEGERAKIVDQYIREQKYFAREKAKDAANPSGKLGGYAKAIERLNKISEHLEDLTPIQYAIAKLRSERDRMKYDQLCEKAKIALAKGNQKGALGHYAEAYLVLRSDSTADEEQVEMLREAKEKIVELGGTPPEE